MWKQSVWTSTISSHLATLHLKPGGLLTLSGAKAALTGTGGTLAHTHTHTHVFTVLIMMTWLVHVSRQGCRQTLIYWRTHCAYSFVVQPANSCNVGNRKRCRALTRELTYWWSEPRGISRSSQQWEEKVSIKWIQENKTRGKKKE